MLRVFGGGYGVSHVKKGGVCVRGDCWTQMVADIFSVVIRLRVGFSLV